MKQAFRPGTIFSIPLPTGHYLFGRVVFAGATQVSRSCLAPTHSYLAFFGRSILIEVYCDLREAATAAFSDEVLIPGVFTSPTLLAGGGWPVLGHRPVDPTRVAFPEVLGSSDSYTFFKCGELALPTPFTWAEYEALPFRATIHSPYTIGAMGLHYLGRRDLIEEKYLYAHYLEEDDLRYCPSRRAAIYAQLQLDPTEPYYQLALRHGLDLQRLY